MRIIDLRSDTVTRPTNEMRQAMSFAEVGDDVYGDDPTVIKLEELSATLLQKEAALFVPSGTFGNQLALLTHCQSGNEVILDDACHIVQHEAGGAARLAGVQLRTFSHELFDKSNKSTEKENRIIKQLKLNSTENADIAAIESRIRKINDIHYPKTGLICLENAHSNGCVLPLSYMDDIVLLAKKYNIPIHLDGARIFNAAEYLKKPAYEIAARADSVMFCLSKGLCSPIGSVLVGKQDFIDLARKNRKIMGGGLRQVGMLAAAGIISLQKMTKRLNQDHKNAKLMGKWLAKQNGIQVNQKNIHINMVFCDIKLDYPITPDIFVNRLQQAGILINPPENPMSTEFRFVTHNDIKESDIKYFTSKVSEILTKDFW
ncbi:MAG: aminotransferase class I/II-fold pyridoxal phosphate-dependent enzyme [Firmicutes bacterium]|nr:aminotransferase class I/II-fold pyridoxal phosphate-dependent enzyme [Bacillota bacterium]